jgi:RING-box protein 1
MSKPKFEIIKSDLICSWKYKISCKSDCAICYNSLSSNSVPDLQNGIDSEIQVGSCGHAFHSNCINPWIKSNPRCPLCSNDWINCTPSKFLKKYSWNEDKEKIS